MLMVITVMEPTRAPSLLASRTGAAQVGRGSILLPTVFFLSPLATCMAPRLTPFFIAIIGFSLIGAAVRRGVPLRALLPRHPALAASLLFGS